MVLVGTSGSGKSTVGELVSKKLEMGFTDVDDEIERQQGKTVREIFATEGERAFRDLEAATLRAALASNVLSVISPGAGAVLDPENREQMRSRAFVVWLRAAVSTLQDRLGDVSERPLLAQDPFKAIEVLDDERRPYYVEVCDEVVDTEGMDPREVAEKVVALVRPEAQRAAHGGASR